LQGASGESWPLCPCGRPPWGTASHGTGVRPLGGGSRRRALVHTESGLGIEEVEPGDVDLERERLPRASARRPVEPIPQMFAQVAQGKSSPADALSTFASKAQQIYRKWHNQKLV
jgi:hypothetical protein